MSRAVSLVGTDKAWPQIAAADAVNLYPANDFTLCCFVYFTSVTNAKYIWSLGTGAVGSPGWIIFLSSTRLAVYFGDGVNARIEQSSLGTSLTTGRWYALVVTFDRDGNAQVWVDGTVIATFAISTAQGSLAGATTAMKVGCYGSGGFDGNISHPRVYHRVLTAAEITRYTNLRDGSPFARPFEQLTPDERVSLQGCWDDAPAKTQAGASWLDKTASGNDLDFARLGMIDPTTNNGGGETVTAGSEVNSFSNTGFETFTGTKDDGISDTFSGYSTYTPAGGTVEATATCASGSTGLKLVNTTARPHIYRGVTAAVGGTAYRVSFAARGDGTKAGNYSAYDVTNGAYLKAVTSTGVTGTTFQTVTFEFQIPLNCTYFQVYLYGSTTAGTVYFDDLSIKALSPATFVKSEAGGNHSQVELSDRYAGAYAFRMDVVDSVSGCNLTQSILTLGREYEAKARCKVSDTTGAPDARFLFGTGASYTFNPTTSWAQYSSGTKVAAGTTNFYILKGSTNTAGKQLYWDDVELYAVSIPSVAGPPTTVPIAALAA